MRRWRIVAVLAVLAVVALPGSGNALDAEAADAGGNPFVTDIFTADPGALVHDGRLYVYTGHDEAALGVNAFVMRDWHVHSTADGTNWTDHGVRLALSDFPWANANAWAGDVVERDGKFYWYVPVNQAATNAMSIGVAVGDTPLGPFRDALGGPLIDDILVGNSSAFDIDPSVLVDDDGQAYLYWGSFSSPRVVKLKSNMIELDSPVAGGGATGPRVPGQLGNAVRLNGSGEHVSLPAGIVSGLSDFTIATWVNLASSTVNWARIFDFGTSTAVNMFLTPRAGVAGTPVRFAITTGGGGAEQRIDGPGPLPTGWQHVAVTQSGNTGTLYINGAPVGTNPNMTLRPSSLGHTTNDWIGRSQYPDPFLNATVDDFQIHGRALTADEIAALAAGQQGAGDVASYRFDEDAGPTALDSSGNGRDATIVAPTQAATTPQGLTGFWEAPWIFKRAGTYYMAYARGHPNTGGNPATIDYATASGPLGPWTYRGRILDTVANTTTNHPAIVQLGDQWYIVYHTGMAPLGGEFRRSVSIDKLFFEPGGTIRPVVQTLSDEARRPLVRYGFDASSGETATDTSGNDRHATLVNGPSWVEGRCGNAVELDGVDDDVSLPTGLVWHMYDFTVATWVKLDPAAPVGSTRIFDFGRNPNVTMYLTPQSDAGAVRFALTTTGTAGERRINGAARLPAGQWTHVAVTKSGLVGTLYVDGAVVGQNTNFSLYPARLGNTASNWIGRSQGGPFLDGAVDDFRVYQRGLSAAEIDALRACELYLHDVPSPPVGDTPSQPELPLDSRAPTATTLWDYDTDRDAFPGLLLKKGGAGAGESDPTKAQVWRTAVPQAGLTLSGDVGLTFFAGMKDFDSHASARTKRGFVRAFLRDCPVAGACTLVAEGAVDARSWHGGSDDWIERTITFAGLDHTVAARRSLEVKLVVDRRAGDDMWFAYDTIDHPSRLILP